ncbi:PREDICTED: uncharacterized protein LOC108621559 [Drosophila arizonae]|uniref:Uncharacterized protein LOC108621559 n=1 Tax=Drosophila arizonae TaxID=7263 RepID=A0ABM1Q4R3_DROAR|nr:PREDICTED: uncharacterized protein LOC108621559 [Drosophila arizonae]
MFLNDLGQPLILDSKKTYGPYEQHNGPMLLTSAAFQDHIVPSNWCGRIIGSADDVARFQGVLSKTCQNPVYTVLRPNEETNIKYDESKISLTLIPAGQNEDSGSATFYYLKNDYIRSLIADNLSGYLDFIPKAGASFHRALGIGIDVLYFDDSCYASEENEAQAQREYIYTLVKLLRPKYLYGLRLDKLPKYLLDLCVQKDMIDVNNINTEVP